MVSSALRTATTGRRLLPLAVLALVALQSAAVGVWAGAAPSSFVADFPGLGLHWIVVGHGYDEHFVRDVGFLHLALCVIATRLLWREVSAGPADVRTFGLAWSAFAIPHLVFHLTHTDGIHGADLSTSLTGLVLSAVAGIVLLLTRPPDPDAGRSDRDGVRASRSR